MSDAIATVTSTIKRNHEATLEVERAKSVSMQQLSDVRLALALEDDNKKKQLLDVMATRRIQELQSDSSAPDSVEPH